jgi:dTDP-glucose pyrophosphorylase
MNSDSIQAVILAAGEGTRIAPLSTMLPKPLLPVCNKSIVEHQIEALRQLMIREVAIVIGPSSKEISNRLGDGRELGVNIQYFEDPAPKGSAASLSHVESWVRGQFVLLLGDIFFPGWRTVDTLLLGADESGVIVARHDTRDAVRANFAVIANDCGQISEVMEKPDDPPTDLKGCGIYILNSEIFDAIPHTPPRGPKGEICITDSIQVLLDRGCRLRVAADVISWDVNVTFPHDLLDCNVKYMAMFGLRNFIAPSAFVGSTVELCSTVIGSCAHIEGPTKLDECIVLPRSELFLAGHTLKQCILGSDVIWARERAQRRPETHHLLGQPKGEEL